MATADGRLRTRPRGDLKVAAAPEADRKLHDGTIRGRAVVVLGD
ncbi:hypothetical protein ACI799_02280 [Blastococcus sp. SYSU DS0753]